MVTWPAGTKIITLKKPTGWLTRLHIKFFFPYNQKQDKYTMDPRQSNLSQQKENDFWSKMTFEQ